MSNGRKTHGQKAVKVSALSKNGDEVRGLKERIHQVKESLRESERRFITLIDALGDLIHVVDSDLHISLCNKALKKWHGYLGLKKDPVGERLPDVCPFWSDEIEDEYHHVFEKGESKVDERNIRIGDCEFVLKIRKIPIFKKGQVVQIITSIQDITPYKRAEEALERKNLQQEQLIKMARQLTESPDVTTVLAEIGAGAKALTKAQACTIYFGAKDGQTLTPAVTNDPLYSEQILAAPLSIDSSFTGLAVKTRRGLIINDAWKDERGQQIPGTPMEENERVLVVPFIADDTVQGAMCLNRTGTNFTPEDLMLVEIFATYASTALKNAQTYDLLQREVGERQRAEQALRRSFEKLQRLLEETVTVLFTAVEIRDPYTAGHQRRVTVLACAMAKQMNLSKNKIDGLRMASLIHDIGKIYVPADILSRPGSLTETERDLIQIHPQAGHDVLKLIEFPWPVANIVLQHHERLDGSGFPQGLTSEKILLEAKILGVADVVEAMCSHRPYRPAHAINEALEEIERNKGKVYDRRAVNACLILFREKGFRFDSSDK
jgi:PAS domain S-box-containing protein